MVFEVKGKGLVCVSKSDDGGLEFFTQDASNTATLVSLPQKEVKELSAYLEKHLREIAPSKNRN